MKENDVTLKKRRSNRYPIETIIDADYVDDLTFLANISVQVKLMLNSFYQGTGGIVFYVNLDEIKCMFF